MGLFDDLLQPNNFMFEGFEYVGDHLFAAIIPRNTDIKLRRKIMAAIKTHHLHLSSIDYVLKRYGDLWFQEKQEYDQCHKLLFEVLDTSKKHYQSVLKKRDTLKDLPDVFGLFAAGAALIRLDSSFKTAFFLLYNGNFIEGYCILKLILEQIAWAYEVHQITDEKLYKSKPNKSINSLKQLIPEVGELYGRLNKSAHIDTSQINQHINFSDNGPHVILASQERCLIAGRYMLQLADFFGIVMETIYSDYFSKFEYIVKSGNKYIPNPKRKSLKDFEALRKKVIRYSKNK